MCILLLKHTFPIIFMQHLFLFKDIRNVFTLRGFLLSNISWKTHFNYHQLFYDVKSLVAYMVLLLFLIYNVLESLERKCSSCEVNCNNCYTISRISCLVLNLSI